MSGVETTTLVGEDFCVVTNHDIGEVIVYKPRDDEDFKFSSKICPRNELPIKNKQCVEGVAILSRQIIKVIIEIQKGAVIQATGSGLNNKNRTGSETHRESAKIEPEKILKNRGRITLVLYNVQECDEMLMTLLKKMGFNELE